MIPEELEKAIIKAKQESKVFRIVFIYQLIYILTYVCYLRSKDFFFKLIMHG